MPQTTTTDEKRVVAIGAASLINETVTQLG
jgi:hypothetical protein